MKLNFEVKFLSEILFTHSGHADKIGIWCGLFGCVKRAYAILFCYVLLQTECGSSMDSPIILPENGMRTKPLIPEMCFTTTTEEDSECENPFTTAFLEEDGTSLLISCSQCSVRVHTSQFTATQLALHWVPLFCLCIMDLLLCLCFQVVMVLIQTLWTVTGSVHAAKPMPWRRSVKMLGTLLEVFSTHAAGKTEQLLEAVDLTKVFTFTLLLL